MHQCGWGKSCGLAISCWFYILISLNSVVLFCSPSFYCACGSTSSYISKTQISLESFNSKVQAGLQAPGVYCNCKCGVDMCDLVISSLADNRIPLPEILFRIHCIRSFANSSPVHPLLPCPSVRCWCIDSPFKCQFPSIPLPEFLFRIPCCHASVIRKM